MTAFFPGSFNPFTIGHLDMVARALRIFDRVVIAIGYNVNKDDAANKAEKIADSIKALFIDVPQVSIMKYSGLTIDAAIRANAPVILRGYRNSIDAEYERQLANTNHRISNGKIETILLASRPELECISSSMVRELQHFGYDVSEYLPSRQDCKNVCS